MAERIIQGDVLIVGGGQAACAAALEAAKHGVSVIVIDKGKLGRSGSSATSGGNYQTWLPPELGGHPEDTLQKFIQNVTEGGRYLNNQDMTEIYAREGVDRVLEMDHMGFPCTKTSEGKFRTALTFGMTFPRFQGFGGSEKRGTWGEGHVVMKLLRKEIFHRGVRVLEGVMITRLFTSRGRLSGAYGFNKYTAEEIVLQGKAVVLAAGGGLGLYKYSSANFLTTGDGYRLGYDLGCPLQNMEFEEFTIIPVVEGIPVSTGGSKPATSQGGRFLNKAHEYFMEKYDSNRKDLTSRGKMVQAVWREMREGRGPVFLDATRIPAGKGGHMLHKLGYLGFDHSREAIPVVPAVHSFLGGLIIDEKCATCIPGLYSCGENAGHGNIYGADRVSGALTACHVLGYRAGKFAALYALSKDLLGIKRQDIQKERKRVHKFGESSKGQKPKRLKDKIKTIADSHLNVCRDQQGLEKAVQDMMSLQEEARTHVLVQGPYDMVEAMEAENLALTGEMIARSALLREESRGQHCRVDLPGLNNNSWLRWIQIKKTQGDMGLSEKTVPIKSYPFQPQD